jgi:predicted transcriptional regulator of viral defense system
MAKGTYISQHLTQKQIEFLLLLDDLELDIFTLSEIREQLGEQGEDLNELLENLVDKHFLSRMERGKYCRSNFRDEKVIGAYLVPDGAIAYWSALHHYGLTEQFPNSVFVQTTKVKADKTVFGVYYKFVTIAGYKRTQIRQEGYGNHRYAITSLEKTLVDCFDLPQYSGGYAELVRAFSEADANSDALIEACSAIGNLSVTKRMGFLAEWSGQASLRKFVAYAESQTNERYSLLDPSGEAQGAFDSKWRLRLNISREEIEGILNQHY